MEQLYQLFETTPLYVQMAVMVGFALLGATVIVFTIYPLIGLTARRLDSYTLTEVRKRTRSALFWVLTLLFTLLGWESLLIEETDALFNPWYLTAGIALVRTVFYVMVGLLVIRFVDVLADTLRHRYSIDNVNNLRERKILTQLQYIQRIIAIVVGIIVISLILLQFPSVRSLGAGLLTSAGVGGIIIGLAAQKSIANLLAGFQIAFTQPIRVDDALIVNGEYGWVEEITLTYVVMRLWDQRRQIVPLQNFIDDTFQNWTRTNSELLGSVFLYLDYTFPVQPLREEVERFLKTREDWDQRVGNCLVTDSDKDVMTIRVLVSAKDAGTTFNLRCATREHLISWVQEHYRDHLPKMRVEGAVATAEVGATTN